MKNKGEQCRKKVHEPLNIPNPDEPVNQLRTSRLPGQRDQRFFTFQLLRTF